MSHSCCDKGYFHKGDPKGQFAPLGADGRRTYISGPEPGQAKAAILIIADVFGVSLNNNKLIADYYAKETGARVYVPDFFDGEDCWTQLAGAEIGSEEAQKRFNFVEFLGKYSPRDTSKIEAAAKAIKALHPGKKLGAVGFCWGAPGSMRLGSADVPADAQADAVAWAHPSLLELPGDIANLVKPSCLLTCETDPQLPKEQREIVEAEINKLAKKGIYSTLRYFPGVTHGWAVRGDEKDDFTARATRDAQQTLAHFFTTELL
ncbi:hypothetical protein OC842_005045 [Tilletia horrida]|uniref:Dienelactone hydrolase domain-containing protein n=1 Tax=Tilletia horrida TaxID=155126 RepID=A0AAN6G8K1_9BASI|nr:hypothetical protein OC842_005045 [Tilletia horrida]KAK0565075.1 hypothetical protein OC844_001412 [Tilletia horrida]